VPLPDDGVIVARTFSKAFGLASARIGYALATADVAAGLNARQEPAPVSTLSAALALAALEAGPPDVSATIAERERLADGLRSLGLEPLPSSTNFLFVPHERAAELADGLLGRGLPVRPSPGAIRITVHRPEADDRLLAALGELLR
jgi:histidinol-phosphate aminotransferase